MAKRMILISSLPAYKKATVFVAILFVIAGCSAPNPIQSTAEEDYKAQKKLVQLQSCVDAEDYIKARFALSSLQKDFSNTNFYKEHSGRINELAGQIEKETQNLKIEDKVEYLFIPPCLETKLWKEYMSRAEGIISRRGGAPGIAVLRVTFEDEGLEWPSLRVDRDSEQIYVYYEDGGISCANKFKSGGVVFVGSEGGRYNRSGSNDENDSVVGNVTIGGIYHYPTKLKIEIQKGKAVAFGEVVVRSIPQEYCGNLKVKAKAEKNVRLTNASVSLEIDGFMPGKSGPVKGDSCLFSSVGPGSYGVKMACDTFGGPGQSAVVVPGQTTEVTISAYRHRMIELDWRFREANEPNNWLSGRKTIRTKEYWQPNEEWGVHYPVVEFGDWLGNSCEIKTTNGDLMRVNTDGVFEDMNFPSSFSSSSRHYLINEGDIFAWRRNELRGGVLEALFRIRKITPIEVPD